MSHIPVHAPHHTEVACQGHLHNEIADQSQGQCSIFSAISMKRILVANSALMVHQNLIPVRLFNATDKVQKINKGERIATYLLWNDNEQLVQYDDESDDVPQTYTPTCHSIHDLMYIMKMYQMFIGQGQS